MATEAARGAAPPDRVLVATAVLGVFAAGESDRRAERTTSATAVTAIRNSAGATYRTTGRGENDRAVPAAGEEPAIYHPDTFHTSWLRRAASAAAAVRQSSSDSRNA